MTPEVNDLEREWRDLFTSYPLFKSFEVIDIHPRALKVRLFIAQRFFVQLYANMQTGTRNFVLVLNGQRVYGRDCMACTNWHRHPFNSPDDHDFGPEGAQAATTAMFLSEVQEIIADEELL